MIVKPIMMMLFIAILSLTSFTSCDKDNEGSSNGNEKVYDVKFVAQAAHNNYSTFFVVYEVGDVKYTYDAVQGGKHEKNVNAKLGDKLVIRATPFPHGSGTGNPDPPISAKVYIYVDGVLVSSHEGLGGATCSYTL